MFLLKIQIDWFDGLFIWLLCICSYTHLLIGLFICSLIYQFIYLSLIDSSINLFVYLCVHVRYTVFYLHGTVAEALEGGGKWGALPPASLH